MSRAERALRAGSLVTVLSWLAAYLVSSSLSSPPPLPPETEATARLQPRLEQPPEPSESPRSSAQAAPAQPAVEAEAPPAPTSVSASEIAEGAQILDGAGGFPALSSSYEDFDSFDDYARAMVAIGARFVVVRNREIVGSLDPRSGALGTARLDRPFSPRARDYTGEPGLARMARSARERFGEGAVVMMLVPRELDAGLFGGISAALESRGESHDRFREIRGRYQKGADGGVLLRVDAAVRSDGREVALDLLFDLVEIARTASPEGRA